MENTPTTPREESVETPAIAEMSLAEYRASRETEAADHKASTEPKEDPASGEESLEETAADETDAADDTTEQESEPNAQEPKPAKKKGGFQRKIEQRDQRIAELERQLAEKNSPAAKPAETTAKPVAATAAPAQAGVPQGVPQFDKPKPKLEECESLEEFTEKLSDWKADQREFVAKAQELQQERSKKAALAKEAWETKQADARTRFADYDETLQSTNGIQLPPYVQRAILDSEHGADIAYSLAKDHAELKRIAQLEPLAAARAIGRLESKFEASAPKPVKKISSAPEPVRPIASAKSSVTPDVSKLSLADYRRQRESGRI